jgi:hypothetical protein
MTHDEISEIALQAKIVVFSEVILELCQLVAKEEREACAKVCEDGINNATDWDSSVWDQACENRAFAIRARNKR